MLFALSVSLVIAAGPPPPDTAYRLGQLVERARQYMPALKQRSALVQGARAAVTDASHSVFPTFRIGEQASLGTDNSISGSYLPITPTVSTSGGIRATNSYDLSFGSFATLYGEYELMNFGLQKARVANAESYVALAEADLHRETYNLELTVGRAYFLLDKAVARAAADQQNIERYREILGIIRALARSGVKPGADTAQAIAELSRATVVHNQTMGQVAQLKETLSSLTGIEVPKLTIDTLTAQGIDSVRSTLAGIPINLQANPLIESLAQRRHVFQSTDALIRKSYSPKVLVAGAAWARGSNIGFAPPNGPLSDGLGLQRFNYMAGLGISYDLSQLLHRSDRLAVNRALTEAAEFELQQGTIQVTSASAQADNAIRTADANLVELPVQLQSAQMVYRQKLAQYRAGVSDLIDLTNASFVLYRSQTDFAENVADWYLAQLDRAAAIGSLGSFMRSVQ
jgi:outer membrane protein TolC